MVLSAEISRYMTVSSAKSRTVELTPLGRLLMYTRNIAGSRTDPWELLMLQGAYQTQPRPLYYRLSSTADETSDPFESCGVNAVSV